MEPAKPRLLDLFCGAGGAAMGYHRAGFEIVAGVDIASQPRYPFPFVQDDALAWLQSQLEENSLDCDAIHASPPCQAYSVLRKRWKGREWPDLLAATRELLEESGLPYVIENVPGSPMRSGVMLCGGGWLPVVVCGDGKKRQVRRHRLFETNWPLMGHPCNHPHAALGVYGHGKWSNDDSDRRGGYQGDGRERAEGMGIDWMTQQESSEAVPPAYTEFIGEQLAFALSAAVGLIAKNLDA